MSKICDIQGCSNPVKAKGLCNKHYMAKRREEEKNAKARKKWGEQVLETFNEEPLPDGEWSFNEFLGAINA